MTVVPFPRPHALVQPQVQAGVRIAPRRDLRTGMVAAGAIRSDAADMDSIDMLLTARSLWRDVGQTAPLAIAPPPETYGDAASAGDFTSALLSAGFSPRGVDIEVDEDVLANGSLAGVERFRARGFGVALRAAPGCPLAFSQRTRSLFTEVIMAAPSRLDPFLGLDPADARPLARRLHAAKGQGILVTAVDVGDIAWARALSAAGFDRGEGPFAP
ncbi:MAG: hypothetical protein NW200_10330 [Hyphomonadaceae bacterium]|nr:hypothetical protein [Hyphomonadaceae bacterium]